jgi:Ca2+-binding EF-hand superfamily protein
MRVLCAGVVEEEHKLRISSVSPMIKLKDKLYRKNEKLYKSFGMFDLDKVGSVTVDQFADTVDALNVS